MFYSDFLICSVFIKIQEVFQFWHLIASDIIIHILKSDFTAEIIFVDELSSCLCKLELFLGTSASFHSKKKITFSECVSVFPGTGCTLLLTLILSMYVTTVKRRTPL